MPLNVTDIVRQNMIQKRANTLPAGTSGNMRPLLLMPLLLLVGGLMNGVWADNYTYQVVDLSNKLATKAQVSATAGSTPEIPDVIKNRLVTTYHYWPSSAFTDSNSDGIFEKVGNAELATLPAGDATVYVTYDYDNSTSLIDLSGTKVYYVKDGDPADEQNCHYLSLQYGNNWISPSWVIEDEIDVDSKRQWRFEGGDPYKIYFRNIFAETYSPLYTNAATAGPYMRSDLSAGSFEDSNNVRFGPKDTDKLFNTYFIDTNGRIVAANNVWNLSGTTNRYIYLAKESKTSYQTTGSRFYITGSGKIDFGYMHYSVSQRPTNVNYTILTKQKKVFMTVEGDAAERLHLPSLVQSPLVSTYHYWPASAYADSNSDGIYEKDNAVAELDASTYTASEGETIYVTYDYDADNAVEFGSNTVHVDLTGKTRYTINTGSEASVRYITWRYDVKRTLVTLNDSYYTSRNNTTEPATWNDYWFWTLGYEDGSEPDPYAIVIKSGVPTQYPVVGGENYVLSVYQGTGTDNSNTDIWSIPKNADGSSYVKTWALLTDNKLVCRKPGTATKVNRFNADGSTRPNNYDEMGTNGEVLLNAATIGYYVVNRSGQIAVSTRVNRVYTGNLSVPADLKSAHIIDDGLHYRFFSTQADAAAYSANPTDETAIEHHFIQTYAQLADLGSTEVYVGYHYDAANIPDGVPEIGLQSSSTSLSGIARYHVQINNKYWKSTDVNWHDRPNFGDGGNELVSANYQWLFVSGNSTLPDPYDIRIKTPYWPDGYLHDMLDNVENGNTNGAYSTGHGMYLCRTTRHDHDQVHSFFFTQSDIGIVVSVATLPNKQGRQSYLYNYNNQYALLQRSTRGGDSRQKFNITPLRLFRVVNKAGNIAVSAYMPATSPLTVPTGLRTPLMTESQYRFFTTQEKAAAYNLNPTDAVATAQGAITTAPATGEIFIGYNYVNNPEVMDLEGSRWYNIKGFLAPNTTATSYYYYQDTSGDVFKAKTEKSDAKNFMFQFTGNDPYDIVIYNAQEWNNNKQPLFRWGRDWGFNIIQQRNRLDDNNGSLLHFMMLEHEDGYTTLAVHNNWWYNGNFNLGAAGSDVYIGTKYYLYFWGFNSDRLRMMNNDSYFHYYSDRNRNGNYATKLVFEPVQYTSTIHIIDNSGREAIKYTGLIDANMPIDFAHIPATIRSPFLIDETITGYSTATANGTSTDGRTIWNLSNVITQTPATSGGHIYIRYTTDHVYEKPFRLTGARSFNVRINGNNYIYSTGTGNEELAVTTDESGKTTNPYYWHLLGDGSSNTPGSEHGGDPYAFRLWNNGAGNSKFLKYNTSTGTLTLDGTDGEGGTYFIAMRNNVNALYEVMAAGTGVDASENYYNIGYDGTNVKLFDKSQQPQGSPVLQMLLSTNDLTTTYYIIDKSKKIVAYATENAIELEVPAAIRSPLVSQYKFWKLSDFTVDNNGEAAGGGSTPDDDLTTTYSQRNDTYTLLDASDPISSITSASQKDGVYQVYVTYDVNNLVEFNGRNRSDGKMYMLKFAGGQSFYQEDGHDGVTYLTTGSGVKTKAVYPYSNGDANLYIYGEEQWTEQSGNAATTRSRWPWYVVSENEDPYHVKIQSRQGQNSDYNYFRTYKPQGYDKIVTGVITQAATSAANHVGKKQTGETDEEYAARKARQVPSEYMVLGTQGAYKLQTVELISDEHRTVTSFEQYWKTYDTAKKKVLGNTDPDKDTDPAIVENSTDRSKLENAPYGWHAYKAWANAKRWNGYNGVTNKQAKGYEYLEHWFQTIEMGDGTFDFVEISIDPALILIDKHGWEIMRKPIPISDSDANKNAKLAAIKVYDSPMVKAYHFNRKGVKVSNFHKFIVSNPAVIGDVVFSSTSMADLPPYEARLDADGRQADLYVTYDVKKDYASSYSCTRDGAGTVTINSPGMLIKQGSQYAMDNGGVHIVGTNVPGTDIENNTTENITDAMKWYIRPNYNIDTEMGVTDASYPLAYMESEWQYRTKEEVLSEYFDKGQQGFDPYNVRIQNVGTGRYFANNATATVFDMTGGMQATYSTSPGDVILTDNISEKYTFSGHDQSTVRPTNATFMVVADANGNMRLMPRFDHHNVMTNFATIEPQMTAAPVNDNSGSQTTRLLLPASYVYIVVDNSGYESIRYRGNIGDVSPSIPAHLASPLAKDFKFYKNLINDGSISPNGTNIGIYTEVANGTDISAKEITGTFGEAGLTSTSGENIVYVRYSFNPEGDKYKILSEGGWHTISIDGKPLWVNYSPDENNPTIPIADELPPEPGYEWQCKFIYNPDTEVPDPYNASTFNRVKPNRRWDVHYAVLAHGNEIAFLWARQGDYDYKFLSSVNNDGTAATTINFYKEPYFDGTATYAETVSYTDPVTSETITETVTRQYDAGTFNGTVSQITFGDIPEETVTYYVITNDGHLALTAKEPSARAKGEPSKPTAILPPWARSPLLNVEDFRYYMQATDNGDGTYSVSDGDLTTRMIGLPENKIYVRYNYNVDTTPFTVKDTYFTADQAPRYLPLDLTGNTWYNIVTYSWGDDWLYTSSTESNYRVYGLDRPAQYQQFDKYPKENGNFKFQSTKPYLWRLVGSDPYAFKMVNSLKGNSRYFSGKFSEDTPDGTSLLPQMLTEADKADITTFMILKPMSNSNDIRIVATGRLNYYLSNTRWGSNWISYYDQVDESNENPFQGVSYHGYEFFKAPVIRNYTFHAMNCDGATPVNTWTMTLQRDWLTPVTLEADIARICAQYEKEGTYDKFVDLADAGAGRFYHTEAMGDTDADRIYDSGTDEYDIYPEIGEDETYDIYFKYRVKGKELAAYTSTAEDIATDVAYHKANGRLDETHPGVAKWWFMVLDTDENITATGSGDSRTYVGRQMFLRREDNGGVGWMNNDYSLHKSSDDNYNNYSCHRLAEWYKQGDNDAFREGRWLWTFVGTDPYLMKVLNLESAVGVTVDAEGVYSLDAADNCYVTTREVTQANGAKNYPALIPSAEPTGNQLWGMAPGYGTEHTFSLVAPITNDSHQALFWTMNSSTRTDSVAGSPRAADRSNAIQLIRYVPVKYEDVNLVIRRSDEVAKYQAATAANKPGILAGMKTGISKLYFGASERMFAAGDKIDMSDEETLPLNVRRAFCDYTLYKDIFTTVGGNYVVTAGPYPTTTQATTTGSWSTTAPYVYNQGTGEKLYDEDGKPIWAYLNADGTPAPGGAQSIYASYEVTSDIFLKTPPTQAEVEAMSSTNDHVYFMDFPNTSETVATTYSSGHHAYYDELATFADQVGTLYEGVTEKMMWNGSAFVNDNTRVYNYCQYKTAANRMESVPENLKWYFVGDPYKVQVYSTAGAWNTTSITDTNNKTWDTGTKAANLCRFDPTETMFQFVVDCVHLRVPDYTNIDQREMLIPTDETGKQLPEYEFHNRNYNKPYYDDFYWECVPAASNDPQAFALRFKEDNDYMGYRNVYYYLSHDGLTRKYRESDELRRGTYNINLSYNADNERQQSGDYKGYHAANNEYTVIKLVQPVKLYVSAFKEKNNATPTSQWTPNPNTGGMAANSSRWQRMTTDELSEYYGLGETVTAVPRHLQRKFVKYGTVNYQLSEARAYNYPLSECTEHVSDVFVTGTKINPVFKLNVSYKIDDVTSDDIHLFTTDLTSPQWLDMTVSTNSWLYYDKTNLDSNKQENQTSLVSNYRTALNDNSVSGWDDGLKGLHWAFVGDPYDFTIVNRRRYEDAPSPTSDQWLAVSKATIDNYAGVNDSVIWTTLLVDPTTQASCDATASSDIAAASIATHFSTQMWKTGGDDDYFLRTASLKTGENDYNNGSTTGTNQTNNYWRMVRKTYTDSTPDSYFTMVPYHLSDKGTYTDNTYSSNFSKTMKDLGVTQQLLTIRTATVEDNDGADNDCFDANIYIYNQAGELKAQLKHIEVAYGDVDEKMPRTLRRYGCTYPRCYQINNDGTTGSDITDFTTMTLDVSKAVTEDGHKYIEIAYVYTVDEEVEKFFTTSDEARQDEYTWSNAYFNWEEVIQGNKTSYIDYERRFDHYVYSPDGHIIDEVYTYEPVIREADGSKSSKPFYGWVNTHTGQTRSYADQTSQTENDDQKWSFVGDPYDFEMKNYAKYLQNEASSLTGSATDKAAVNNSIEASSHWAIMQGKQQEHIDNDGKTVKVTDASGNPVYEYYLALIDDDPASDTYGAAIKLVTFDRKDGATSDQQYLYTTGGVNIYDPTGKSYSATGVKPFYLSDLMSYANMVVYHLVIAHQHSRDPEDLTELQNANRYDKSVWTTINNGEYHEVAYNVLDHLAEWDWYNNRISGKNRNDDYPLSAGDMSSLGDKYVEPSSLRDVIHDPIPDYIVQRVGVGNRLKVPWYMERQFCTYDLYQRDVMKSVTLDGTNEYPIGSGLKPMVLAYLKNEAGEYLDSEGNVTTDPTKYVQLFLDDAKTQPAYEIKWVSVLKTWTSGKEADKPSGYDAISTQNDHLITKLDASHKNRMVVIDVVYHVNPEEFRFADKGRNTTAWYSMMTNNPKDGLMNFSYKDGIGARHGREVHYTNNYLWAPEGDPYGFILHSRYATINGTGWDNVVVTTPGKLPESATNEDKIGVVKNGSDVIDYSVTYNSGETLAEATVDQASYTGQYDRINFRTKRITHPGRNSERKTWSARNAIYEMFVGMNDYSFLMHPTSAYVDITGDKFGSFYMIHNTTEGEDYHKAELRYVSDVSTLRLSNADANWRLMTTPEQLLPYFERSGYVGGLQPNLALHYENKALYDELVKYKATYQTDPSVIDFQTIDRARELVYKGKFYRRGGSGNPYTTELLYTEDRPTDNADDMPLKFVSNNLIPLTQGYYRIQAFSGDALNKDGENVDGTRLKGVVGPRYISGYRHESEKQYAGFDGTPMTLKEGSRWLHFYETDEAHTVHHVMNDMHTLVSKLDGANYHDRDAEPHPAMRGNIEILPAEYDPSTIFYFTPADVGGDSYDRWNIGTQGLRLRGRAGGRQGEDATYGVTKLVEPTAAAEDGYDDHFRINDIGGTAFTMRLRKYAIGDTKEGTSTALSTWDDIVAENLKTNYLCIDANHRYRITIHKDNEMKEIGDGYAEGAAYWQLPDINYGIQDTKWLLQPVGVRTEWPYNEMPLRVKVNKGGQKPDLATGLGLSGSENEDPNYYASLYVPFDTRLNSTIDAAFTATVANPMPKALRLSSVSQLNNMGNPQFIPAAWPVVIRSSAPKTGQWMTRADTNADGIGDGPITEDPAKAYRYVELYIPTTHPTDIPDSREKITLHGSYLETMLSNDDIDAATGKSSWSNGRDVMVLGLPFVQGTNDKTTTGEAGKNKSTDYYAYQTTDAVGFYTNENWRRDQRTGDDTAAGATIYSNTANAGSIETAHWATARNATYQQRSNRYVYHNKAFYVGDFDPAAPPAPARPFYALLFDDEEYELPDEPQLDEQLTPDVPQTGVYDISGRLLRSKEAVADGTWRRNLRPGVYIVNGRKMTVR